MTKAYDTKVLVARLKEKGINIAEDAAGEVVKTTFGWAKESAVLSENKVDDMVAPLLIPVETYIMTQIDKIDGEKG